MDNDWKDLFYFTKSERRGIAVLSILILFVALLPYIYQKFSPDPQNEIDFEQRLAELQLETDQTESKFHTERNEVEQSQNLFSGYSDSDPEEKKQRIEQQKTKEIHSVPPNQSVPPEKNQFPERQSDTKLKIDINTASAEELTALYGIGPVLSGRIVKFRQALGGFVSVNQIADTYGLEPEVFSSIKNQLVLESKGVKQLNINTANQQTLGGHPYISDGLAKQMINYREKVKLFETDEDVKSLYFVDEELFRKLKPYITY